MVEYGVDEADIFQTNDLFEKKDLANVTNTIFALGRAVSYQIVFQNQFYSKEQNYIWLLDKPYVNGVTEN